MIDNLKKCIVAVTLIATFFISNNTSAQYYGYEDEKNIRMGLMLSPNIGWLKYNNDFDVSNKLGFSYGLIADIGFAKNYYFSTGLLINSINSGVKTNQSSTEQEDRDIFLKYAEVPLTVKLKSELQNFGKFYGQFGFTAGVKVGAKEKPINGNKRSLDGEDIFRLGLQIGGGTEWNLGGNLGLLTGLSLNNGFTRAVKGSGAPKNSYLALNVGILF